MIEYSLLYMKAPQEQRQPFLRRRPKALPGNQSTVRGHLAKVNKDPRGGGKAFRNVSFPFVFLQSHAFLIIFDHF